MRMSRRIRRRGTRQFWRWLAYLSLYILLAGSTVSGLVWGRNVVLSHPRFAISRVVVSGCTPGTAQEVKALLEGVMDQNLFRCDLEQVRRMVVVHRWVHQVVVRRHLPDSLFLSITEETPAGLALLERQVFVVNREGQPICEVNAFDGMLDVPVLVGLDGVEDPVPLIRKGLSFLNEIKKASLLFWGNLETLDLSDPDNVVAHLAQDRAPVNLGDHLVEENLVNFLSIAEYVQQRYPNKAYIELGFPGQVVVMPNPAEGPN